MRKIRIAMVALGVILSGTTMSSKVVYSPMVSGSAVSYIGNERGETYNVAIRLSDPNMEGLKIRQLSVPFPEGCTPTDISGWLTSKLSVQIIKGKRQNVIDMAEVAGNIENGKLTIDFTEDYVVPEGGLYAGYSFTLEDGEGANALPVAVAQGSKSGSLYLYTSRKYMDWADQSEKLCGISAMEVVFEGDEKTNSVGVIVPELYRYNFHSDSFGLPVELVNHGSDALSSIEYSYTAGDRKGHGVYTLPDAAHVQWGHSIEATIPVGGISMKGTDDLSLVIEKVNGVSNEDAMNTSTGKITGLYTVPVHRPLVEEYTGLWCGYCPRGIAGMEHMNNNYPEEFVGVSFHDRDPMTIFDRKEFPAKNNSVFPSAWINRSSITDPYFGENEAGTIDASPFGFDKVWKKEQQKFSPVSIQVYPYWDESDPELIKIQTQVRFVEPVSKNYRIGYYLLHDAMEDETWEQLNYCSGWSQMAGIEEMYKFVNGESYVNIYFDDVPIMSSDINGVEGSLPSGLKEDELYVHTFEFRPSEARNIYDAPLLQDKDYLKVVAYVIQEGGTATVLNANVSEISDEAPDPNGVESIGSAEVIATEYYNLNGLRVRNPEHGVYVRVEYQENGSRKVSKVIY